ncbi:hypothetical protein HG537_0C04960 [Torulaspora globosa]|uniref:Uncharacterized protein n=1 Tax=Torulaspora globosa TaxID=48254 RepID=A0A7H9HT22_9SACH|nr:hypothetical protein HG537_0C04960 [Torulaspora sp. CBS 2947]
MIRSRLFNGLANVSKANLRPRRALLSCSVRTYAQSWDGRKPNEKIEAHMKVQKLMDDIQAHPKVMEKLNAVSEIMISKGLASEDSAKPVGPWQMIKIMMDKDLKIAMNDFKTELENAGIDLGPDQLGPLMTVLGIEKKSDE